MILCLEKNAPFKLNFVLPKSYIVLLDDVGVVDY